MSFLTQGTFHLRGEDKEKRKKKRPTKSENVKYEKYIFNEVLFESPPARRSVLQGLWATGCHTGKAVAAP